MRWCEIDWEARQYRKDGEEMKNGIGHIVPLSRQAIAILEGLKPVTGHHEFVFANIGSKKPLSEGAARKALARLGFLSGAQGRPVRYGRILPARHGRHPAEACCLGRLGRPPTKAV
ncbi:hypothetical protein HMPREF3107_00265 [Neisseria sp. HMSC31F04]|nr:hypothetical protein HMPREF3107_00265 [Neisseria sp. HMSC31F04]